MKASDAMNMKNYPIYHPDFVTTVALNIELMVRHAWKKVLLKRRWEDGKDIDDRIIQTVKSSMTHPGKWIVPDPTKVIVSSETGLIDDPYRDGSSRKEWDAVVDILTNSGHFSDAGWECVNAGVHYVWTKPIIAS